MANIIKFEIKTDAPYSDEEQLDLLEAFFAFMRENDADVIEDSETLVIVDENDVPDDSDKVRTAAIELVKSGMVTLSCSVSDSDGEEIFNTGDVPVAIA